MKPRELRDPKEAEHFVLQSLLLSRASPLNADRVAETLEWSMEIVSEGAPLPLAGFVGDVGQISGGSLRSIDMGSLPEVNGLDHSDTRRYEDYVLGKLYVDLSFERAADATLRFQGRDRHRAVAYLINRLRSRGQLPGVILTPAVIKGLLRKPPDSVLQEAWELVQREGVDSQLIDDLRGLTSAFRGLGELVGPEDLFELESGTALDDFGQRIALRQVLCVAEELRQDLPKQKPRSMPRQNSVATNLLEEDHYPIGGFTSISNRGTIESLVRSELAYIDPDSRPDLFDIKFARNELLYYSRDENQFLRRRLTFVFVLLPDLVRTRIKDRGFSYQRVVLLLATLYVMTQQLMDWLGQDAIEFQFLFVREGSQSPLEDERSLVETLFREESSVGTVLFEEVDSDEVESRCEQLARRSLCHTLTLGAESPTATDTLSIARMLKFADPVPKILVESGEADLAEETGIDGWRQQIESLLRLWA
ncbi:MAG: hypothetical protein ACR2NZ_04640 [Rubripirellula sp.]